MNAVHRLRQTARPVNFQTGIPGAPLSTKGTAFVCGYAGQLFVLTARHVLRDFPAERLFITPWPGAKQSFRLADMLEHPDQGLEDRADIALLHTEIAGLSAKARRVARIAVITPEIAEWHPRRWDSTFFAFGYPIERARVDYDAQTIEHDQIFLQGRYSGESVGLDCHTLSTTGSSVIADIDGMSGSPVYCLTNDQQAPGRIHWCGVVIRGSATSSLIHFVDSQHIVEIMSVVVNGYATD